MRMTLAAALATLIASTAIAAPMAPPTPIITIAEGKLAGRAAADGLRIFKGVAYAEAPVGALRWKPPVAARAWAGVRAAEVAGPACLQPVAPPTNIYADNAPAMSEDCLSLNVWAPKRGAKPLPVMVWIHGGALVGGYGGSPVYEAERLARRGGVIVVTINYRLGILGYLAHPGLSAESPQGVSGNYGLLDQIEALKWVRRNIAAFGGDPANVTIAGESAGALSVMDVMASPLAKGLFARAIAQSAYMVTNPALKTPVFGLPSAEQIGTMVSAALHAPDVAALRAIDGRLLVAAAAKGYMPLPTIDGWALPRQLVDIFDRGEQAHVPILTGFNAGEIRSLRSLAAPVPADAATYEKTIRAAYGDLADAFLKLYPATDLEQSILAASRDGLYGWTSQRLVRAQAAAGAASYLYLWDHSYPAADAKGLAAFHASEVPYMFGNIGQPMPAAWPAAPDTATERALSAAMVDYWTSFARTGKPVAPGAPAWARFADDGAFLHFRDRPEPASHVFPGSFALQEQVVCRRRASGTQNWLTNIGLSAGAPLPPATPACTK